MSAHPDLFSRQEAAAYLRMSVAWLDQAKDVIRTRLGGKVFYLRADLDKYVQQRRQVPEGEQACLSTSSRSLNSIGAPSTSTGSSSAPARAKSTEKKLRKQSEEYAQRQRAKQMRCQSGDAA